MIVLDTNVISELFRPAPERKVLHWIGAQDADRLFTTAISEAEIFRGIEFMPAGRRRADLLAATEAYFRDDLAGKVLSFDSAAARHFAEISAIRKRKGLPLKELDIQIAAVVRTLGASLATRNTKDFEMSGITLINPWNF
jgi:toxin FitB